MSCSNACMTPHLEAMSGSQIAVDKLHTTCVGFVFEHLMTSRHGAPRLSESPCPRLRAAMPPKRPAPLSDAAFAKREAAPRASVAEGTCVHYDLIGTRSQAQSTSGVLYKKCGSDFPRLPCLIPCRVCSTFHMLTDAHSLVPAPGSKTGNLCGCSETPTEALFQGTADKFPPVQPNARARCTGASMADLLLSDRLKSLWKGVELDVRLPAVRRQQRSPRTSFGDVSVDCFRLVGAPRDSGAATRLC